jgi:hypothetical protein
MAHGGYLPAHAHFLLDQACVAVGWAFDSTPFLVGSSLTRGDYRDVDVRVVLDDDVYDRWFPGPGHQATQPLWSLLASAISLQLGQMTGLPVDFQVQRRSDMPKYDGQQRVPLGIFPVESAP